MHSPDLSRYAARPEEDPEWNCRVEKCWVPLWLRLAPPSHLQPQVRRRDKNPPGRARGRPASRSAIASTPAPSAATSSTSSASSPPPSKAGFHAIEPWITELDAYTSSGGSLKDLGKRIADAGLTVEGAIAFNSFLEDDDARRAAALEKLKVDMDKVAQIGGKRIAAPPGSPKVTVSLDNAAKYYREALEMGEKAGVQPLLELWGTHPLLGPLSRGIYVTVAAGRPDASLLLDVFHLYKSGTAFTALKQINGASLHLMHLNDYPQAADPATLNDGSRIYPGDGVAPLRQILRDLRDNGFRGYLSLELFNKRGTGPGAPTRT